LMKFFIQHTAYAITTEQSRFTLSGAKFEVEDNLVRMVATDGHRLAIVEKTIDQVANAGNLDVLIPKKALTELVKLSGDSTGTINFGEDKNNLFFVVDGKILISRKLTGSFPNYKMVIPTKCDKIVKFDAEAMKMAVRRVALMADDRQSSIRFLIKPNEIEITAVSAEEGEALEIIQAEYEGEETVLAFNWKYLVDALQVDLFDPETESNDAKSELLCLEFKDNQKQVMFHPEANEYLSVIMPVRY
ncbi:MAG TPA: DNA polymerase III subunit beta, partial [Pyrinomonadaceae bacterium]|nr:DNA polymerase III subunit beta [Pyrinomonadaceae bacterium]